MGIGARNEDIRKIEKGIGKERGMENRKEKMEVMKKKVILRDEMVKIEDDSTRKERAMHEGWRNW